MNHPRPMTAKKKSARSAAARDVPRDFVGAAEHVMNVLRSFDAEHPQMTLSEVARRTGLDRAGARRYLVTLAHLGYVRHDGKLFRLAPKVLELGYAYMATMPLAEIAKPYLRALTDAVGEPSAIAVLDGYHIVHLARAMTNRRLEPSITIGQRFPALHTSTGRVLVAQKDPGELAEYLRNADLSRPTPASITSKTELAAELERVRKRGYAIVDQELEEGIRTIAVPVLDANGRAVAAINVVTNAATVSKKKLVDEILPQMRKAAQELRVALMSR